MYEVEVKVNFRYGHRLVEPYKGKCSNVHGEYGTAIFLLGKDGLTSEGFVVDFGAIKKTVKEWIDENWDHAYLHSNKDEVGTYLMSMGLRTYNLFRNPTAENMAEELYCRFEDKFDCKLVKVGLVESSTDSIAWYIPE